MPAEIQLQALDLTQWQEAYKKLAKQVYEGKISTKDLDKDLIQNTYLEISQGAAAGYGKSFKVIGDDNKPNDTVISMRRNIFKFSGAKSFVQLVELNHKLSKDGKVLPWEEFKTEALKLNDRYNVNYLQAEYQTAKQAASHASNWEVYQRDKHRFPNLKYKTQRDERVRDEHRSLDGIVAPIESDFWKKYYPPNGWRCRCYVVQSAETPSADIPKDVPEVKPEFQLNVGIGGQVFNEGTNSGKPAPYFALAKAAGIEKAFERAKEYAPYEVAMKAKTGAKVEVNIFADLQDLEENFEAAKLIAKKLDISSKIRPHINLKGYKNPEFEIDGIKGDRVNPTTKNIKRAVSNAFDDKLAKGGQLREEENTFLIYNISFELTDLNLNDFVQQSWQRLNHYKKIDFLILTKEDLAVKIDRSTINEGFSVYRSEVFKMRMGK